MGKVFKNITEMIGNTPLLELSCVHEKDEAMIYGKCEFANPGSSVKDRISLSMISPSADSGSDARNPSKKKPKTHVRKPKQKNNKKKVNKKNTSFNNPLAEALIKSGFKQ